MRYRKRYRMRGRKRFGRRRRRRGPGHSRYARRVGTRM